MRINQLSRRIPFNSSVSFPLLCFILHLQKRLLNSSSSRSRSNRRIQWKILPRIFLACYKPSINRSPHSAIHIINNPNCYPIPAIHYLSFKSLLRLLLLCMLTVFLSTQPKEKSRVFLTSPPCLFIVLDIFRPYPGFLDVRLIRKEAKNGR